MSKGAARPHETLWVLGVPVPAEPRADRAQDAVELELRRASDRREERGSERAARRARGRDGLRGKLRVGARAEEEHVPVRAAVRAVLRDDRERARPRERVPHRVREARVREGPSPRGPSPYARRRKGRRSGRRGRYSVRRRTLLARARRGATRTPRRILRLEGPDDDSDDSHDPDPESWSTRISTPGRIRVMGKLDVQDVVHAPVKPVRRARDIVDSDEQRPFHGVTGGVAGVRIRLSTQTDQKYQCREACQKCQCMKMCQCINRIQKCRV